MALPLLTAPAFLIGIIGWLGERITSRAFKIAAAAFYVTSLVVVVGGIFALLVGISAQMPDAVTTAMSVGAPRDWAAQSAIVIAAKTTEVIYSVFFRAYRLALS